MTGPPPTPEKGHALLRRLAPTGDPVSVAEVLADLDLRAQAGSHVPPDRPWVGLNMICSVDGRAAIAGRTAALGNRADRELFHGLRGLVDGVLVGAGTVRDERYGRMMRDPERRRQRLERGLPSEPLACIVSARLALSPDLPLLAEPEASVVILTPSDGQLEPTAAHVDYIRAARDGELDMASALGECKDRFGVRTLLCEGGPRLNATLLRDGLVDELFLAVAPKLVAGLDVLTIVTGESLDPPLELELTWVLEFESCLFLRYRVLGRPDG